MKPLLVILGYQKANDMICRHMPFFRRSGCHILGVGREDTESLWPAVDSQFIGSIRVGKDSYVSGDNLIRLHLDVLDYCLEHYHPMNGYSHYVICEPDLLIVRPIPKLPNGLTGTLKGGNSPGFFGSFFPHFPVTMDCVTARWVVPNGRRMLKAGLIEKGFPDRFYGLMCDLYAEIEFINNTGNYSQNLIDRPEYVAQARDAIQKGAWAIHGIKTAAQLQAVTEGLI